MISPRKLASLPRKTRLRKILTLVEEWGRAIERGTGPPRGYLVEVLELLREEKRVDGRVRELAGEIREDYVENADVRRKIEHLRFSLMESMGLSPADWDFCDPETQRMSREEARILPMRVYLDDIRSPFNVGSIFRSAEAFGAAGLYLSEYSARPDHKRAQRTSMGCTEILPWRICGVEEIPPSERGPLFALELGGSAIEEFEFPESGIVVVGSEELGVSPELRECAREEAGIVSIPLSGAKASLNVAVAFGILMQYWHASIGKGKR